MIRGDIWGAILAFGFVAIILFALQIRREEHRGSVTIEASPEQMALTSTFLEADILIEIANLMIQSPEVRRAQEEEWRGWYTTWRSRRSHLQAQIDTLRAQWAQGECVWNSGRPRWTYEKGSEAEAVSP